MPQMMQWKKMGRVFDPTQFSLPNGCALFAQAPQALMFEKFVRVYFSSRSVDPGTNLYRSHIAYVDMAKNFREVIGLSQHTVIELGKLGTFDEHGIFPMNVLRVGKQIYGYTSGVNRRLSVPVDGAIGLAISNDDGYTFQRVGDGPVLAPSLHEPYIVVDPFVQVYDGVFHMWYVFGIGWKQFANDPAPGRVYKIGHAVSADGVRWKKEEARHILSDKLGEDECQALPTVIQMADGYHMFFCYRHSSDFRKNSNRAYRIGHAHSHDLQNWHRDDSIMSIAPTKDAWDSDMLCYPHVFQCENKIYMLYNGNEFGKYGFGLAVLD
jgi:hypothetical protein